MNTLQIWGPFIGIAVAGLLFLSGYATLLLPKNKALSMPLAGRINEAFGPDTTLRFVQFIAVFLMAVGVMIIIASLAAILNNVRLFTLNAAHPRRVELPSLCPRLGLFLPWTTQRLSRGSSSGLAIGQPFSRARQVG